MADHDTADRGREASDAPTFPDAFSLALLESAAEGLALFEGGQFLHANSAFREIVRVDIGNPLEGFADEGRQAIELAIEAAASRDPARQAQCRGEAPLSFLREGQLTAHDAFYMLPKLDKEDSWVSFWAKPVLKGNTTLVMLSISDITGLKTSEKVVRECKELHEWMMASSPAFVTFIDPEGFFIDVNPRVTSEEGEVPETFRKQPAFIERNNGLSFSRNAFERALNGELVRFQSDFINADGQTVTVENSYRARFVDGKPVFVIVISFDVSDRVRVNMALRESRERLRRLVETLPNGMCRTDRDGRLVMLNPLLAEMLGYKPEELIGRSLFDFLIETERKDRRADFARAVKARKAPIPAVGVFQRRDGGQLNILVNWALENEDDIDPKGFIVVMTDVTKQIKTEQQLRRTKEIAERASMEKSRFLAATSHDLQQPLHSLSIMLGLMRNGQTPERRTEILDTMERALEGAQGLLRAVLDLSKLEAGVVTPNIEDISVDEMLSQIKAELGPHANVKPIELRVVRCTRIVRSDRFLLKRILYNLVSNAIRYTYAGKVLVGARLMHGKLSIEVWDTGVGIPKSRQKDIFQEFTRLEHSQSEQGVHSLGLGLSIVERACSLLGHELSLRSELGKGSVFRLAVPLALGRSSVMEAPSLELGIGGEGVVLIVEDNVEMGQGLQKLVRSWGYRCFLATNAASAMEVAESGSPPDLLLVDYNLGEAENGLNIVDRFRAAFPDHPIPAILATAEERGEPWDEAAKRQVPVIAKPVNPARLRALVSFHIQSRNRSG
jgi:PAS domain S-box-containing protein